MFGFTISTSSSQRGNDLNILRSNYSSSTPLKDSNSAKTTVPIEGSREYREMKRMYLHEGNQAEE